MGTLRPMGRDPCVGWGNIGLRDMVQTIARTDRKRISDGGKHVANDGGVGPVHHGQRGTGSNHLHHTCAGLSDRRITQTPRGLAGATTANINSVVRPQNGDAHVRAVHRKRSARGMEHL